MIASKPRVVAGRFTIVKPLYRPETFHARDGRRHVAIEVVTSVDDRLRAAVDAAAKLDHPSLWRVHELVEGNGEHAIVLDLVDGTALADRILLGAMDPAQASGLLGQLLGALGHAHAAGIVHGALTAHDVMIDSTGKIKLAVGLRAPRGATDLDDLRAVGAIAYAMLAGDGEGAIDLSRVPAKFRSWIRRCTSRLSRFPDVAAAATALAALRDGPRSRATLYAGALAAVMVAAAALWLSHDTSAEPAANPLAQVTPRRERSRPPLPTGAIEPPDQPLPALADVPAPAPAPLRILPPVATPLPVDQLPPIAEVRFSAESTWIEDAGVFVLEPVYRDLMQNKSLRIEVTGHSSGEGDEAKNRERSLWRAMAVKNYLVGQGIEEDRIVVVARGSTEPLAPNTTADGRAKNRRAEIRLLPGAP